MVVLPNPRARMRLPQVDSHRGQALVLGLFVVFATAAVLLLMFNSGRTVDEKMRLANAADATAWSIATPCATARSKITLPGRIVAICASVMRRGAARPGISAVVMTMSCLAIWPETSSAWAFWYSSLISVA